MVTRQIAIGFGLTGIILFSTKSIFAKLAYQYEVDAINVLLLRMVFSLPFYLILAFFKNEKKVTATKNDYLRLLLLGFLGYYLASYFDFKGLEYIKASLERLILFIYPTFVIILSFVFLKIKISRYQFYAILVAYFGICIVFLPEIEISTPSTTLKGSLLVLLSAVTYASYIFGSGCLIPKFGTRRFTCYVMIVSSIMIITQFIIECEMSVNLLNFPKEVYMYGILIAIFSTVIPSFLISHAIKELGPNQFSLFGSIGPISTLMLANVFLEERLSTLQVLGSVVVIMGIFATEYFKVDPKT
tara:strand:- start:1886 stop:2788 length:903 start_codon:yes stop_codon:yes gene_type:complete